MPTIKIEPSTDIADPSSVNAQSSGNDTRYYSHDQDGTSHRKRESTVLYSRRWKDVSGPKTKEDKEVLQELVDFSRSSTLDEEEGHMEPLTQRTDCHRLHNNCTMMFHLSLTHSIGAW